MRRCRCPFCDSQSDADFAERYDQLVKGIEQQIAGKHKCAVLGIFDADPPYNYSIGLTDQGWPELIVAGVDTKVGCGIINNMVERFTELGVPKPKTKLERIIVGMSVQLAPVSDEQLEEFMHQAIARQERVHGPWPRALQIVFPDTRGRWPSNPKCNAVVAHAQRLILEREKGQLQ